MLELRSHLAGRWQSGDGRAATLYNPTTEAAIATCSTAGLDLGEALAFARTQGGPALRELTFAQRGALLQAMREAIHAEREGLIELAVQNGGNTRGDAKFDIDGARRRWVTTPIWARAMGDRKFVLDGEAENIGAAAACRASTCACRGAAWPCTSTPSTSRPGAWPRRPRPRCWPACPCSASRRPRPPSSPTAYGRAARDEERAARRCVQPAHGQRR
jgi:hypothetical protein